MDEPTAWVMVSMVSVVEAAASILPIFVPAPVNESAPATTFRCPAVSFVNNVVGNVVKLVPKVVPLKLRAPVLVKGAVATHKLPSGKTLIVPLLVPPTDSVSVPAYMLDTPELLKGTATVWICGVPRKAV